MTTVIIAIIAITADNGNERRRRKWRTADIEWDFSVLRVFYVIFTAAFFDQ